MKLKLPVIKVKGRKCVVLFEIGNINKNPPLLPSQSQLAEWHRLLEKALTDHENYIVVPHGMVRIKKIIIE